MSAPDMGVLILLAHTHKPQNTGQKKHTHKDTHPHTGVCKPTHAGMHIQMSSVNDCLDLKSDYN